MRKIGLLLIALMIALGVMGVVFSGWTETVYITGIAETGFVDVLLGCGESPLAVDCHASYMTLDITVTAATEPPTPAGTYLCHFNMGNFGSLPVRIQDIEISDLPDGVHVSTTGVVEDTQIDPGDATSGTVNITLDYEITENLEFTVTFNIVLWNQP